MIRFICNAVASLALVIQPIASWGACSGCACSDTDRGGCCDTPCDAGCCGADAKTSASSAACLPANGLACCSALSPPASSLQSHASHLKPHASSLQPPNAGCQSCANQCACSIDRGSETAVWTTPLLPPELALIAVTAWDGPTDSADGMLLDRQRPVPTRGNRLQSWLCVWVI